VNEILPGLTRQNLGHEVLAGVTLLAIAPPLNIGYAQIAGLPATAGLCALVPLRIVFALLASSRHLVAAPDAAAATLDEVFAFSLGVLVHARIVYHWSDREAFRRHDHRLEHWLTARAPHHARMIELSGRPCEEAKHYTTGVWIADASGMPSRSGVNPMVSTMALARRTAMNMLNQH
jgi:hypothetical protein